MPKALYNKVKEDEELSPPSAKPGAYSTFSFTSNNAGQILPTIALAPQPPQRISTFVTDVTVSNTTETTVFTFTFGKNLLGTANILWTRIYVQNWTGDAVGTFTTAFKYGGVTQISNIITPPSNTTHGFFDFYLSGAGSLTSQELTMQIFAAPNQAVASNSGLTSQRVLVNPAVDTTGDQTITITFKWSAVAGGNSITAATGHALLIYA